jgi:hypothetical protein
MIFEFQGTKLLFLLHHGGVRRSWVFAMTASSERTFVQVDMRPPRQHNACLRGNRRGSGTGTYPTNALEGIAAPVPSTLYLKALVCVRLVQRVAWKLVQLPDPRQCQVVRQQLKPRGENQHLLVEMVEHVHFNGLYL